jgi:hypothetical protein
MSKLFGGWSIDKECYDKIIEILPEGKILLEFGSGRITNEFAKRYVVYSVEHDEEWVGVSSGSTYIHAPLKLDNINPLIYWYDVEKLKNQLPEKYDLILIDGPPASMSLNRMTRQGFYRNLDLFNLNDVILVFDDVHRKTDMENMLLVL